jgi:hypothetical protein
MTNTRQTASRNVREGWYAGPVGVRGYRLEKGRDGKYYITDRKKSIRPHGRSMSRDNALKFKEPK